MDQKQYQLYRFGKFQIDANKRLLLCDEAPVRLPPRALDVLLVLVEHSHYVMGKDELMRLVWGERVVEENNLTRQISTLRKALDESPDDHRYIVTVPGRGYSFIAPVETVPTNDAPPAAESQGGRDADLSLETERGPQPGRIDPVAQRNPSAQTGPAAVAVEPSGLRPATGMRKLWLWATAPIVILTSAAALIFQLSAPHSKPAVPNSYRDWEVIRLTRTGGAIVPAISRDGKYVAYVNKEAGQESVWVLQLATSTRQQIVPPEKFAYFDLLFTPDGSELYFTRREGASPQRALYRTALLGGIADKLRDDIDSPVTLSPDGTRLGFARRNAEGKSEFIIANADGVEEHVLVGHRLEFPAWSPDGKVIAYSAGNAGPGGNGMRVYEIRLADGSVSEISPQKWDYLGNKSWLPDGSGLILTGRQKSYANQLWLVAYPSGEARQLSGDLEDFLSARLTADARTVVAEQITHVSDIWSGRLGDMASAKKVGVWGMAGLCRLADGRIVYSSMQSGEANKIFIMNADGSEQKQLTFGDSYDTSPAASPDGPYIVFASDRSGNFEIWRMDLDGRNLLQLTNNRGAPGPSISPDGRWVIYAASGENKLYRIPIEGGEPRPVVSDAMATSAVSPDGKLIAYFTPGKDAWGIAVSSFENGSLIKRFDVGSHSLNNRALQWTPDGKALLYSCSHNGVGNLWRQPLAGGPPQQVTDFKAEGLFRFDVSRDGKELICARGGWKHDIMLIKNFR